MLAYVLGLQQPNVPSKARRCLVGLALASMGWPLGAAVAAPERDAPATEPALPVIRWVARDLPPFFSFVDGRLPRSSADLGSGGADGFLRVLVAQLPQYRHEFVEISTRRYESAARAGETLCSVLHLSTPERRAWAYFTPLHPPLKESELHLIAHRDNAARWGLSPLQPVSLASVLQRTELTPLITRDRSYGPELDALLRRHPSPMALPWSTRLHQPLAMLVARRADYTLEYPAVLAYQRAASPSVEVLVAIPLAEQQTTPTMMISASCSRTVEGRRRVDDIDAAVRRLASEPMPGRKRWLAEVYGKPLSLADFQRFSRFFDERALQGSLVE